MMNGKLKRLVASFFLIVSLGGVIALIVLLCVGIWHINMEAQAKAPDTDVITLRVCNWEEYIDLGEWEEDEVIDLESGDIFGERALYEEFEDWYYETYGKRVQVEYSCFGTNEELYNMLTLGDVYDLVCPSDYMIMKLMTEGALVPYSEEFFDEETPENYYIRNVSPYIRGTFENNEIGGERWSDYAAGYMWGVTGFLYNPDEVAKEDAETLEILRNPDYCRQITLKDNVRDSYFAALGAIKGDLLCSEEFLNDPDYGEKLADEMNDVSAETIAEALDFLQDAKDNAYSFETDSGKADMVTGKVLVNYQWSGDAVYAMDQAEEDDYYLAFAVPKEATNLWFDGWAMLKSGIGDDAEKQHAAEAFVNFLSRPDNAVRNIYYIGYTSAISGGTDGDQVYEYMEWTYGAEDEEEDTVEYDVSYFFGDEDRVLTAAAEQMNRQLYAQYPPEDVIRRSAVMRCFDEDASYDINHMWIGVRCYNIRRMPAWGMALLIVAVITVFVFFVYHRVAKTKEL